MTGAVINLATLGITPRMVAECSLPPCQEPSELIDAGNDLFGRPQRMTPETLSSWHAMQHAAGRDGIELQLVSAFRSINYQCEVIQRKLQDGRTIEDILGSNAIPGYSEHHTGRALDLHSGKGPPLEEVFEQTPAFNWLVRNADRFCFYLSYPRDNQLGISYEPWHWCYKT